MYSAFYDTRDKTEPLIRVIGVTLSKNSDNVYCNVFHRYLIDSKMTKGKEKCLPLNFSLVSLHFAFKIDNFQNT